MANNTMIEGVITKISEKSGEKNGKPWTIWSFNVVDKEGVEHICSTFDRMISENTNEDESVVFEITVQGKYNNISSLVSSKVDEEAAKSAKSAPRVTSSNEQKQNFTPQEYLDKQKYWEDKEKRQVDRDERRQTLIIKQSSLSTATELVKAMDGLGFSPEEKKKIFVSAEPIEVIKNWANKLYKWVIEKE